ncbi:MAG: cobalamin B12-binding domain-containing protein [Bacteroidales bacterium]|nr:cobalamin B12-binding domain-containing protein [Bacteroidales bacterium]
MSFIQFDRKINKLMLVFPPTTLNGVGMEDSFPPNGLLSIANYLNENKPEIEIRVVDGSVTPFDKIVNNIKDFCPDIVGFSILLGNYSNAKKLLKVAKDVEAITVVGNHHAKYLFNLVQDNPTFDIPHLDYIIEGKRGEYSLLSLINAIENNFSLENIESLAYKSEKYFRTNSVRKKYPKIKNRTFPSFKFIDDFSPYFESYSKIFRNFHEKPDELKQININYIEGCRQGCSEPCIYCCLKDHKIDFLSPADYWKNIQDRIELGFNYFFETCNSLSSLQFSKYNGSNYLESLANSIPSSIAGKFNMMVYARADEINTSTINAFKKIGVHRVIFGFDSGDDIVLKNGIHKKDILSNSNINAARILNSEGIQIYACYVPGSESESNDSLKRTYEQIQKLLELRNTSVIEFTSLAPMPGSSAWKSISTSYIDKYGLSDEIDIQHLAQKWIEEKAPNITWDMVQEYKENIRIITISKNKIFGGYY